MARTFKAEIGEFRIEADYNACADCHYPDLYHVSVTTPDAYVTVALNARAYMNLVRVMEGLLPATSA